MGDKEYRSIIDVLQGVGVFDGLPIGLEPAIKFVNPDWTTYGGFEWWRPGSRWVESPDDRFDPQTCVGGGLHVANTIAAAQSGGAKAAHCLAVGVKRTESGTWQDGKRKAERVYVLRPVGLIEAIRRNGQGADLRGADLRGANLEGADLERAYLERANLERANLLGANLRGAYLWRANLQGANLRGANLERAHLEKAYLRGAYLWGAYLAGAYLRGVDLRGADLERADLEGAYLERANLRGADLLGANHNRATIWPVGFDKGRLNG